jgi:hypothetical protein
LFIKSESTVEEGADPNHRSDCDGTIAFIIDLSKRHAEGS